MAIVTDAPVINPPGGGSSGSTGVFTWEDDVRVPAGPSVPNATVTITEVGGSTVYITGTDGSGRWSYDLPDGRDYDVEVSKEGYTTEPKRIRVPVRETWTHDFINVKKDMGAVGDGVTDDQLAIQAGIEQSAITGKWLYFPPGDYAVGLQRKGDGGNGPIVPKTGARLVGEGEASRIIRIPNLSDKYSMMLNVATSTPEDYFDNFVIKNMCFDFAGDEDGPLTTGGWVLNLAPEISGNNITLDGVYIKRAPAPSASLGMGGVALKRCHNVLVTNCVWDLCNRDCLDIYHGSNIQVLGCSFRRNGELLGDTSTTGAGWGDDNIATFNVNDLVISGCSFNSPKQGRGRAIWILGSTKVTITSNVIRAGWRAGILIEGSSPNDAPSGETGQPSRPTEDVIISGNVLDRIGEWNTSLLYGDAIHVNQIPGGQGIAHVKRVNINNNIINSPRRHGIRLSCADSLAKLYKISIENNIMHVDRQLTHYDFEGSFLFADTTVDGGEIHEIVCKGNISDNCWKSAVSLKGAGIIRARFINDYHTDTGQALTDLASPYRFEGITSLFLSGCYGGNHSGEARMAYGAEFISMVTTSPARVQILNCDFLDASSGAAGNVFVSPSGSGGMPAAPARYQKDNNLGAGSLP